MKFPAYWAKATAAEIDRHGKTWEVSCWRGSDIGVDDAMRLARDAAQQVARRLADEKRLNEYAYGQRPLREEVLQLQVDAVGRQTLAITRNVYGSLVLNTADVMFIDVDFAPVTMLDRFKHVFARLLGKRVPTPAEQQIRQALKRLETFFEDHPDWGVRLYRTLAGLRLLVTHDVFDPCADSTQQLLALVGADPLYTRLCRNQECFRARLTPKAWRCGHWPNRTTWPHEDAEQAERFAAWLAGYEQKQSGYATCRYLCTIGVETVHPDVAPVIELHDEYSRAHEDLPLA